ncbi:NAD(P)-binding protein [Thozetella sp. PMI_491]|nr:NAD(P)-binding protein [Thozetella sp. PMI_491]
MSVLQIIQEQYKTLPVLVSSEICAGKVYIVTGANIGLGLETARHLVACDAARVILAVRNTEQGEKARADIEHTTGRKGVAEVWHLDLASFASVQAFASKACGELERLDCLIENAAVALDSWSSAEGMETSITVNVISTILLGALLLPKLSETARRLTVQTRLVLVVAALGFQSQKELSKSGGGYVFDGFNDPKIADMDGRYALTKAVEMFAVREFAAMFPVEETGVIINMVSPGLCVTGLTRHTRTWTRAYIAVARSIMARTAEEGSRTILHCVAADESSHGKFLSGCKVKEYWLPDWMTNREGQSIQKQIWTELAARLEAIHPGCLVKQAQRP